MSDCVVAGNATTCAASVEWATSNAAMPRLLANGSVISNEAGGSVTVDTGIDPTTLTLLDGATPLDEATVRGSCERASAWDGLRCQPFAVVSVERAPTPFFEGGRPVTLEVVIYTPLATSPPYPAVMFNHGSTGDGTDPALFRETFTHEGVARFFADRGWLVAFPQRRGRGQSDGTYDEGFEPDHSRYSCRAEYSLPGVDRALEDLDAATDDLKNRPDVDTTRMLEAGFSRGGALAIAHVARRPESFRGAINFVGGWIGEACEDSIEVNHDVFARGGTFPGSSIWLYAENDSFYSISHSRSNFDAFLAAGGQGSFHVYERAPGLNGHFLFNDEFLWGQDLADYVAQY